MAFRASEQQARRTKKHYTTFGRRVVVNGSSIFSRKSLLSWKQTGRGWLPPTVAQIRAQSQLYCHLIIGHIDQQRTGKGVDALECAFMLIVPWTMHLGDALGGFKVTLYVQLHLMAHVQHEERGSWLAMRLLTFFFGSLKDCSLFSFSFSFCLLFAYPFLHITIPFIFQHYHQLSSLP